MDQPKIRMTNAGRVCAKCGATVLADAPEGFCSVCLFRKGFGSFDNENGDALEPTASRIQMEFGDYELLEEIGRGGQGVVYRARQKSLNRTVALKVIGLGHWATEAHLKRFRLEAEAAAHLDDPRIIAIYEIGERDGACYFSMQFVEGGQLDEMIKREPMSIRQAAELIAKVARTVHYAHEHGILHRDIKPGNILLDRNGEPHLTDFGLARLVEAESTVTGTKEVLGTPSYMAPEQAAGEHTKVSKATDVYGLGAVLYQLLTGQPPFAGGTTYETIRLLRDTEPRQPRLLNPKIDRDLSTICLKCLEKDPQRRYPSALALAEDLEHWLKHEPIHAKPVGFVTHARKWMRRNPSTTALVTCLVALAGGLSVTVWDRRPPVLIPKSVAVTTVQPRDVPVVLERVATLDGFINANINAQVQGYIVSRDYTEGRIVKIGDPLFQIDPRPFQAALAQAKGTLAKDKGNQVKADADEKRALDLFKKNVISDQERDTAIAAAGSTRANVEADEAAVKQSQLNLGYTKIIAPIEGVAGFANNQVGDLVGPSTGPLITVSQIDPIKAIVTVGEDQVTDFVSRHPDPKERNAFVKSLDFELILSNGEVYPQKGKFYALDRSLDIKTGSIRYEVTFPNPGGILWPGQFGKVRFVTDMKKGAMVIPQEAVNELQGSYQVAVVGNDNKVSIRPVKMGERIGAMWEVTEGLKPGDKVIVEGIQKAREGALVTVKEWTPPKDVLVSKSDQAK